ncbi:ATP-dependent helicase [Kitasatospora sp. NPDC058170]|uniref:ATP-dependent helicase n=1 Tax=Kitasatospora sp. NPDC058170 TaxID=3346364 RepID=UPI0036DDE382
MLQVSDTLFSELEDLHPDQRIAVLHPGNVVMRAGPGSGKTRTLVARAAYLLETQVSAFRGIACITYTNPAADEIRRRVFQRGVRAEGRIVCSTVHAFCLNEILRPFTAITGEPAPQAGKVLSETASGRLLQQCFDRIGIAEVLAQHRTAEITRIRRAVACDEPLDDFDPREVRAARLYETKLLERGEIDFEAMVVRALRIVREHGPVRDLLRARFPHLIVDEYQDMGGVLHALVVALRDLAGICVFAVGDTDQSVFGFTGADAKYLTALATRADFRDVPLEVNYRSAEVIIKVAEAALGITRERRAREGAPTGDFRAWRALGGLDKHAIQACDLVQSTLQQGVQPERIAILYPRKGPLLTELLAELARRGLDFRFEREDKLPKGSLSQFVQRCASRAATNYQIHSASTSKRRSMLERAEAPTLAALEQFLKKLREEARLPPPVSRLALLRGLQTCLDPAPPFPADGPAAEWLGRLRASLELDRVAETHPDADNRSALDDLASLCDRKDFVLQDLAQGETLLGKVLLTTYHSAKGREFDTVILPGLVNGVIPFDVPDRGTWRPPNGKELAEQRRTFYVAVTRAERALHLIHGRSHHTVYGKPLTTGPSDFLREMAQRLSP